jgi:predicted amidohydrolase YtcJ
MILRNVEVEGRIVDALVDDGTDEDVDGAEGALLPGLHDHHLHLNAMAAAMNSTPFAELERAAAASPRGGWLRVVGYHESEHGDLDRDALDRIAPHRPVRVQHQTGAMWVINSVGLDALGVEDPTGRLIGRDAWLQERLDSAPPDLAAVGAALNHVGVTGVTDATPGDVTIDERVSVRVNRLGRSKIMVADHDPPDIDTLVDCVAAARPSIVAFHCASRLGLVLALAALEAAGAQPGDRIEHGAVIPPDAVPKLRALGLTVVTQPAFVRERGDRYLRDVEDADRPYLWRCGSLLAAGIGVAASSDAPHGPADPWAAMGAAVGRVTGDGQLLGPGERVASDVALSMFLAPLEDPGGLPRRVADSADVCLLHVPLAVALRDLDARNVRRVVRGSGRPQLRRAQQRAGRVV